MGYKPYTLYPEARGAKSIYDRGFFMYRNATDEERAEINSTRKRKPSGPQKHSCPSCNVEFTGAPRRGMCQPCYMRIWYEERKNETGLGKPQRARRRMPPSY